MCFGGSKKKKKTTTTIPDPSPVPEPPEKQIRTAFDWWMPPQIRDPFLSLNPLATKTPQTVEELRNRGRSTLTIPVRRSGVGIPGR